MIPRNTPRTIQDVPILQWANGHTQARLSGMPRLQPFVGFHSEVGRDADLDAACTAANTPQMVIRHQRSGAPAVEVAHWALSEQIFFFPLTAGPPATTIAGCLRRSAETAAAGLGLSWPSGGRSRLAVRGYVPIGSTWVLLQLSVRSTMTDHLLAALLDHTRVCTAADDLVDRARHAGLIAPTELALILGPGDEIAAGKAETAQITPLRSEHPVEVTKTYILGIWRPAALWQQAITDWAATLDWAAGYASGETNGDTHVE